MPKSKDRKAAEKQIKDWLKFAVPVDEITGRCQHDHLKFRDATRMYLDCLNPQCQRTFVAGTKKMGTIPDFAAMNEAAGVMPERYNPLSPAVPVSAPVVEPTKKKGGR